tara:strand:+ start:804 stop:983 length:180 start_codon:yes stop_codon:yes gene_type:complete
MEIKEAKKFNSPTTGELTFIKTTLVDDTILYVPLVESNSDYQEIQKQVDAGTLTIKDAD